MAGCPFEAAIRWMSAESCYRTEVTCSRHSGHDFCHQMQSRTGKSLTAAEAEKAADLLSIPGTKPLKVFDSLNRARQKSGLIKLFTVKPIYSLQEGRIKCDVSTCPHAAECGVREGSAVR